MTTSKGGWTKFDSDMVRIATERGRVLYLDRNDNEYPVILVAWRGRLGPGRCRIQHVHSGRQASVGTHLVRPIPTGGNVVTDA